MSGTANERVKVKLNNMKTKRKNAVAGKSSPRAVRFKKILVPVDFSKCSDKAVSYAREFAAQHRGELLLLHVVEPIAYPVEVGFPSLAALPPANDYERVRRERLATLHKRVSASGAKASAKLRVGKPYFEITRAAKEFAVDLIIISTHGHTGLSHVFLGSTAERVVRHAECPVLTIRCRK